MKITSFLMFAEPEKLQYPYIESIKSLASFSDAIIINFASSMNPDYRLFEKESHDKLLDLKKQYQDNVDIKIIYNEKWPNMYKLKYEDFRLNIQDGLDICDSGWFLKCDGDNIFQDFAADQMRDFLKSLHEKQHCVSFPRINVINRQKFCLNFSQEDSKITRLNKPLTDIYALNIDLLRLSSINFEVSKDPHAWGKVSFQNDVNHLYVTNTNLMPVNYDATFFTKERLIDFWKKTHEAYETSLTRKNHTIGMSDVEIINEYVNYRRRKSVGLIDISHPSYVINKIDNMSPDQWGYDNFANNL